MELDEAHISKAIIESFFKRLSGSLELEVAICGGGPAGLTAAYYLAKKGIKVGVFEKNLSVGGGMWGGGMRFNEIVVQEEGKKILEELGVNFLEYSKNYYTASSVEAVSTTCSKVVKAGATIFNCVSVEDVILKEGKVCGIVVNWTPVEIARLHVDPIAIKSKYVIEATGHQLEVLKVIEKKCGGRMFTETGKIMWEKSMDAGKGEKDCVEFTKEVFPNVYVTGMAANAAFGRPRMGPIFGGMLLSGKKVAELLIEKLGKK